ncbi:acyl-CoA dehydrogenase C-terminal domain-containing protein [Thalassotalea sp. Y01]|uniref:acyl-CoA dehydrogenase C-terminal domain-containing protein n=1 Tax=Thalassotalea sp. Y01 TaxID=2729613 RepID=UPI00145C994B|nr:acyl-CoA dehydrogenase C-terminal domain-containing protein [Thalassotalea sp. Y01]NMP15468.1 acyl-CoA dehydrogenase [Thalassotalea sp. Y01]
MFEYKAPLRDYKFVMQELFDCEKHYQSLGYEDASTDMVDAILSEAAKFTEQVIAPINQIGDQQGCQWHDGKVTTPDGFKDAYQQYIEGGWPTLSQSLDFGGQGLPHSINSVISEMLSAANHSFAMYPGLSHGCMSTLEHHGSDQLKNMFMPKLVDGSWTGTMCLTESHCGTDLGLLRTKADLNEDGTYSLNGSKIFISAGEHDLSENIVHLVIARVSGSPAGTKGISLFVVPKFNVNDDGTIADENGVSCGSIEHKMGINGNATCVINFDNAKGYMIGEQNRGLHCMFTFMNGARLGVANEGVAATEASFQGALSYAQERLQMRSMTGIKNPDGVADPIIVHPDVRRMLLTQKVFAEGGRALVTYLAHLVDTSHAGSTDMDKKLADDRLALLTPIAKAFLTETAVDATSYGIQVLGGHGFIKEWGMEQLLRDTKICCIYEGTTGIQALDLIGRKVIGSNGNLLSNFTDEILEFCQAHQSGKFADFCATLREYIELWQEVTQDIAMKAAKNPDEIGAASVDYLMLSGYITLAYMWLKMAKTADTMLAVNPQDADFYKAKLHTAEFYFDRILPKAHGHLACIGNGAKSLMTLPSEHFSF